MLLHTLEPGARFRLPYCGKTGELVRVGLSAAVVRFDGEDEEVVIEDRVNEKRASFQRKARPVQISPNCEVELI